MNSNFDNQKETLLSLRQEISLLRQQVDYLLRNEKSLGLLDLDVLMNRTHTVYDMLCSINVNSESEGEEEMDLDPEMFSGLFGSLMAENGSEEAPALEEEPLEEELVVDEQVEEYPMEEDISETEAEEPESDEELEELAPALEEDNEVEIESEEIPEESVFDKEEEGLLFGEIPFEIEKAPAVDSESAALPVEEVVDEVVETLVDEVEESAPEELSHEEETEELPISDEFGLFFRFDSRIDEKEEPQPEETPEKIVHFMEEVPEDEILERNLVEGEDLIQEDPFKMPFVVDGENDESVEAEHFAAIQRDTEPARPEEIVVPQPDDEIAPIETEEENEPEAMTFVNDFEREENEYEIDATETLGEKLQHEDNTLAAKLQHNSVNALKSAIGMNDKFLFVNELFGGSMEKYNRSIENLDDLQTLNGTLIYLNELKVELQWNSSNEAYQKLVSLIHNKFNQ